MTDELDQTCWVCKLMDCKTIIESMTPYCSHMANVDWELVNETLIDLQILSKLIDEAKKDD